MKKNTVVLTSHTMLLQCLLKNTMQFQYLQIIHAMQQHWKETIKLFAEHLSNLKSKIMI